MDRTGPSRVHARGWWEAYKANFSNHPERDALAYMILLLVFFMYCCVALFENLLVNRYITCDLPPDEREYQVCVLRTHRAILRCSMRDRRRYMRV